MTRAAHYRRQANALRRFVDEFTDDERRQTLLNLIAEYEEMARRSEKQETTPAK